MAMAPLAIPFEQGTDEVERAQLIARRYHAEFVDLKNFKISHELFKSVPVDMMFRYNFVPLEQMDGKLAIAVSDPSKLMVLDEISGLLGQRLVTRVATLSQITELLKKTEVFGGTFGIKYSSTTLVTKQFLVAMGADVNGG